MLNNSNLKTHTGKVYILDNDKYLVYAYYGIKMFHSTRLLPSEHDCKTAFPMLHVWVVTTVHVEGWANFVNNGIGVLLSLKAS